MTKRAIVRFGDPVLTTPTTPITRFGEHTDRLVRDLLDTVDAPGHAGVAATQIGVALRAFSYNVDGRIGYVINPQLAERSDEEQDGDEGCLSVPGLWYPTRRAMHAVVTGVDRRNDPVTVRGSGLLARALQHETDHLDGTVYIDRLDKEHRRSALREIRTSPWFLGAGAAPQPEPAAGSKLPTAFGGPR
ncbi:peptide deformylase [Nocardiopsis coralliicola]